MIGSSRCAFCSRTIRELLVNTTALGKTNPRCGCNLASTSGLPFIPYTRVIFVTAFQRLLGDRAKTTGNGGRPWDRLARRGGPAFVDPHLAVTSICIPEPSPALTHEPL